MHVGFTQYSMDGTLRKYTTVNCKVHSHKRPTSHTYIPNQTAHTQGLVNQQFVAFYQLRLAYTRRKTISTRSDVTAVIWPAIKTKCRTERDTHRQREMGSTCGGLCVLWARKGVCWKISCCSIDSRISDQLQQLTGFRKPLFIIPVYHTHTHTHTHMQWHSARLRTFS